MEAYNPISFLIMQASKQNNANKYKHAFKAINMQILARASTKLHEKAKTTKTHFKSPAIST